MQKSNSFFLLPVDMLLAARPSQHFKRDSQQVDGTENTPTKRRRVEEPEGVGLLSHGVKLLQARWFMPESPTEQPTGLSVLAQASEIAGNAYPTPPHTDSSSASSQPLKRPSLPSRSSSSVQSTANFNSTANSNGSFFKQSRREQLAKREIDRINSLKKKEEHHQSTMMARGIVQDERNKPPPSFADYRSIVNRAYQQLQRAFPPPPKKRQITFQDDLRSATTSQDAGSHLRYDQIKSNAQATLRAPLPPPPTTGLHRLSLKSAQNDKAVQALSTRRRKFQKQLAPDQAAYVKDLLATRGVLSTLPGAEVTQKDLAKLKPGVWLNDEVINFYMIMLNIRSKAAEAERQKEKESASPTKRKKIKQGQEILKVHCFTSFFFTKLKASGYDGVRRWTKKVDIFACDAVLMPINLHDAHWISACINLREKRFEFYDSMGHYDQQIIDLLRSWLVAEHLDKKKKPLDISEWEDVERDDVPQQANGHDCGVFASQMMECCSRKDASLDFAQVNMPYLRSKMIYEIGKQQFLDEAWD